MIKYTIIIIILLLLLVSFISFVDYKIKFIKNLIIKASSKKSNRNIFIKVLMYIYIYIWFIMKRPKRLIKLLLKCIVKNLKKFFIIIFIFLRVKSLKKIVYVVCTMIILLTLSYVSLITIKPISLVGIWDKAIIYAICLGGILILYIVIGAIDKFKQSKALLTIYSIFIIVCLGLTALSVCEALKNTVIKNTNQNIGVPFLIIIINISLLFMLKQILDRASILISVTYGLFIYMYIVFFITIAIGMYITASYPLNFIKDEVIVTNGIITYILSYSYRGAKYLWSFPNKEEFVHLKLNAVPHKVYLLYFIGNFINVIIFAFYVSYSVSMYLLRVSQYENYKEYMNRKTFTSEYIKFLKIKFKIIRNIIKYDNIYGRKIKVNKLVNHL